MKVTIIGVGLIGGSLGLALKSGSAFEITGVDTTQTKLKCALDLGAIDDGTCNVLSGVKDSDLVVIATPVGSIIPVLKKIWPYLRPNTVVTDTGSVKKRIVEASLGFAPGPVFLGAHPIAGLESSGVEHAKADIFRDAACVLTPRDTPVWVIKRVSQIWEKAGSKVIIMTPEAHDRYIALTSHLPHLLASALVLAGDEMAAKNHAYIEALSGGAFRDATRVAASNPDLWDDIFSMNMNNILSSWKIFTSACERILKSSSRKKLLQKAHGLKNHKTGKKH